MRGRIDRHRRRLGRGILAASGIVFALFLNQAPAFGQASAEAHDLPSGRTATTISAVGTLLSIPLMFLGRDAAALGAVGILTGPSIGYFYGGCWGRGLFSTGLRTAFSFIMAAILYDNETNAGFSVWLGGMALSAIYDIATVKKAVNKRNQAKLARRKLDVALAPFAVRKGAGVQLRLSF